MAGLKVHVARRTSCEREIIDRHRPEILAFQPCGVVREKATSGSRWRPRKTSEVEDEGKFMNNFLYSKVGVNWVCMYPYPNPSQSLRGGAEEAKLAS